MITTTLIILKARLVIIVVSVGRKQVQDSKLSTDTIYRDDRREHKNWQEVNSARNAITEAELIH